MMKLVWNSQICQIQSGALCITAATAAYPPFQVDAMVEEQDTYLLMGEQDIVSEADKPAWFLANKLEAQPALEPGTIRLVRAQPLRIQAILYDFDNTLVWREVWIKSALAKIFQEINQRGLTSLSLPLLSIKHDGSVQECFISLLRDVIMHNPRHSLKKLWLILPQPNLYGLLKGLA